MCITVVHLLVINFVINTSFGVWGLETSLWRFGPKFLINSQVQNPSFNFHKEDLLLSRIIRQIHQNYQILKKYLKIWVCSLKTSFVSLGTKHLSHNMSRTLAPVFTKKLSQFTHYYKLNPIKLSNLKQSLKLVVWGIKTSFSKV